MRRDPLSRLEGYERDLTNLRIRCGIAGFGRWALCLQLCRVPREIPGRLEVGLLGEVGVT